MAKLTLDGREHDFPNPDDYDLDEWEIVKKHSGKTPRDFGPKDDDEERVDWGDPGLLKAFAIIVWRRENPMVAMRDLEKRAGKLKYLGFVEGLVPDEPQTAPEPDEVGETGPPVTRPSGIDAIGPTSNGLSDVSPESLPELTGTPSLVTGADAP